ncbi:MAG: type II toxin-antitoxin system HicB family antitoxin [Acidobacteria bacterium]|nr:type II toxin-antitoxin system HicB family antitoxin [Acidobacteriota bacterium]
MKVTVVLERDGDSFHAYCPGLKGLHVGGSTEGEALENAKDAVIAYLDSLYKAGEPIPIGPDPTIEREQAFPEVPAWMVHEITLQWPFPSMSGTR